MKRILISALLVSASLATVPAFAQTDSMPFGTTGATTNNGPLTRAEVKRELAAARAAGVVPSNEFNYPYDYNSLTARQRMALSQANPNRATPAQE
jgi:Domain of unknown function (DUF4148)